ADPTLSEFEVYRGIGSSIGLTPLNAEQMYLWFNSTTDGGHRSVDHPRSGADLVRLLRSYPAPRIADLCERIDPSHAPLVADLYEVTVEPWWSGRMVLCGDAAHAMSPSTGSGGTMAMEDAFVLARALATVAEGNASLEAALDSYYRERLPRVESMRLRTRMASYTNTLPTEELCRLRDERDRILLADPDAHAFEVTDALDPNA
ncbi:MAG: FAD-dependent monooxygenase, partial [Actinomycetales bacterium]